MKHLQIYENFNKSEIDKFCLEYNIKEYKINEDGSIDVFETVFFSKNESFDWHRYWSSSSFKKINLPKFKFKFNRVSGDFVCNDIGLKTLENSPNYVDGHFFCSNNDLTTLLGGPSFVKYSYSCNKNNLKDLYGFPEFFKNYNYLHIQRSFYEKPSNPVCEIINLLKPDEDDWGNLFVTDLQLRFIKLLNEYLVIRNQDTIIESRLLDVLSEMGIKEFPKNLEFKNYQLI